MISYETSHCFIKQMNTEQLQKIANNYIEINIKQSENVFKKKEMVKHIGGLQGLFLLVKCPASTPTATALVLIEIGAVSPKCA